MSHEFTKPTENLSFEKGDMVQLKKEWRDVAHLTEGFKVPKEVINITPTHLENECWLVKLQGIPQEFYSQVLEKV